MRIRFLHSRSLILMLFVALITGVFIVVPANAKLQAKAAGNGANITLSVTSGPPTTRVRIQGTSFGGSETVAIDFDNTQIGTATTNSSGTFSAAIVIPASASPGTHTIQATGQTSGLSASASFLVQTNWNMFGFDAGHTHFNPYENVINTQNVSSLTQAWKASIGTNTFTSATVTNGNVYVFSDNKKLNAFNATTGAKLWADSLGKYNSTYSYSSPAVSNGIVYAGSTSGKFFALDALNGTGLWSEKLGASISDSPTISKGIVYIAASSQKGQGELYALNAFSGQQIWSTSIDTSLSISSPVVANGLVYISNYNGTVMAFNAQTGERLWFNNVESSSFASPIVADGEVFILDGPGIIALNAKTGKELWSFFIYNVTAFVPSIANGIVYIGSYNMNALDEKTGKLLWSTAGSDGLGDATIANSIVYAGTTGSYGNNLYGFDATTGTILWTYPLLYNVNVSAPLPSQTGMCMWLNKVVHCWHCIFQANK
jgi:outer membrane protein assembly factor BamB